MIALALCALALLTSFYAGKRSLGQGIACMLAWGYFHGILRANLLTSYSHFIFDAALVGLIISRWGMLFDKSYRPAASLRGWVVLLMAWPALLILMPFQPFLVSLVGYRGCAFFIPLALLASRLVKDDILQLSRWLAILNFSALGFAIAEYFLGIERFFPVSPVTLIIYISNDVAGGFHRIPGTFGTAHLYGGTMVTSIPLLVAGWSNESGRFPRMLAIGGLAAALFGILLSATRLNFLLCAFLLVTTIMGGRMAAKQRLIFGLLIVAVLMVALRNERFQRFKSLSDTDYVGERISGSVNRSFGEILMNYPMGNGLGGGGTSIPYFLQGEVRNPIGLENEYARILCEQGVIGLAIWLGFLAWYVSRFKTASAAGTWMTARRMAWVLCLLEFGTGWIGTGLLTSVPASAMLMLAMGWTAVPMAKESLAVRRRQAPGALRLPQSYRPVTIP